MTGAFMGLGVALHDNPAMRLHFTLRYAVGAMGLSLIYFTFNEINNGFL
jgi:hypothetical protein